MTAQHLLSDLHRRDVRAWVDSGRLELEAPPGVLKPAVLDAVRCRKVELIAILSETVKPHKHPELPNPMDGADSGTSANICTSYRYDPEAALTIFLAEHPRHSKTDEAKAELRAEYFNELPPPAPSSPVYCDELRAAVSLKVKLL